MKFDVMQNTMAARIVSIQKTQKPNQIKQHRQPHYNQLQLQ